MGWIILAAITSNYYRHIYKANADALFQFKRFATNVWKIDETGKSDEEVALAGIEALEAWTEKIGVARTLSELGVTEDMIPQIADSVVCLPSGFVQLTTEDVATIMRNSL